MSDKSAARAVVAGVSWINSPRFAVLWTLPNTDGEGELASVCGVPQPRLSEALAVFRYDRDAASQIHRTS